MFSFLVTNLVAYTVLSATPAPVTPAPSTPSPVTPSPTTAAPTTLAPTAAPSAHPTSCTQDINEWTVDYVGKSGQFKLVSACDPSYFIKLKLNGIIEYDSNNKKTKVLHLIIL